MANIVKIVKTVKIVTIVKIVVNIVANIVIKIVVKIVVRLLSRLIVVKIVVKIIVNNIVKIVKDHTAQLFCQIFQVFSVALRATQRAPAEWKLQYMLKGRSVSSFKRDEIDDLSQLYKRYEIHGFVDITMNPEATFHVPRMIMLVVVMMMMVAMLRLGCVWIQQQSICKGEDWHCQE